MAENYVETPIPSPDAYRSQSHDGVLSQAALLLSIGNQVRGDSRALQARSVAADLSGHPDVVPSTDAMVLNIPSLPPGRERKSAAITRARLLYRHGLEKFKPSPSEIRPEVLEIFPAVGEKYHFHPSLDTAAELLETSLHHPEELVRIAAAASYFEITTEPSRCIEVLHKGVLSQDTLTRKVAATALARIDPNDNELNSLIQKVESRTTARGAGDTAMLLHGTWALGQPWWKAGGDFYQYVLQKVRADLYTHNDRFSWTGGYSDKARAIAAEELAKWVASHNEEGIDLICHSHGGNVAMLTTTMGVALGELVLLSCPVHEAQYRPAPGKFRSVVSVRVHMDLVIMADRGGQKFTDPAVEEHVLPVWFEHSATHDPEVWKKYDVPQWVTNVPARTRPAAAR
jgi:hypothetical protein